MPEKIKIFRVIPYYARQDGSRHEGETFIIKETADGRGSALGRAFAKSKTLADGRALVWVEIRLSGSKGSTLLYEGIP